VTEIILADGDDLDALSAVIADAFHDLPPSQWLIPDDANRRRIFPGYFRMFVRHALAVGTVHSTPRRDAVALWIPVESEPPALPAGYPGQLAAVTAPWTQRFIHFDAILDDHHPAGFAHHYLAMLAVRPDRQGQGVGSALLSHYDSLLDQAGAVAYLEASSPRNRRLYLRHGYSDHEPAMQLPDGPAMYPMLRRPRAAPRPRESQGESRRAQVTLTAHDWGRHCGEELAG
jgi:GNAT superfamily N-acetyltransferase